MTKLNVHNIKKIKALFPVHLKVTSWFNKLTEPRRSGPTRWR